MEYTNRERPVHHFEEGYDSEEGHDSEENYEAKLMRLLINNEAKFMIRIQRAAWKQFFEVRPVKDGRCHSKGCTNCGYKHWDVGDYYAVDTRNTVDQEKLCTACAESRFCCDFGTDDDDSDSDAGDIRPHPETGLNANGAIPDYVRSSRGWQGWPVVREGQYGLVYVVSERRFGYYDDDDEDGRIVYFGAPLVGECRVFMEHDLRQPPFHGQHKSMV